MLARLDARSIVPGNLGPFPKLNPEFVVKADPDVIMIGDELFTGLAGRPGWAALRSVREQRVCVFAPAQADILVRAGPRLAEAARLMASLSGQPRADPCPRWRRAPAMNVSRRARPHRRRRGRGSVSPMARVHRRAVWLAVLLLGLSVLLMGIGAGVGSTGWASIRKLADDPAAWQIVIDIRLPRTLGAWLAGALLGLAGAVAQGLFRNPLADPFLLGSASGASLGVALALALFGASPLAASWLTTLGLTGAAFIGAMAAVLLTLVLARGVQHTLRLLLAGVIVGVVLGAVGSVGDADGASETMLAMQAFLLGTTGFVGWTACLLMGARLLCCCLATAWTVSPVLDGLALGEATARSLGLPLGPLRAGIGGRHGPGHRGRGRADRPDRLCRPGRAAPGALGGPTTTHARLVGLSALMGWRAAAGGPTLLARCWIAPQELPVGVLTAVLGGGYLLG
jgi:iron complex transport system permease protein